MEKKVTTLAADLKEAADAITKHVDKLEKEHGVNISAVTFERTTKQLSGVGEVQLITKPIFTLTINKK